jgi:hypothetical protein
MFYVTLNNVYQIVQIPFTAEELAEHELNLYRRLPVLPHCSGSPANPLIWWKNHASQFPMLSKFAKQFLCVPATSAPSERIFSATGNTLTKKRNRLKSSMTSVLVFLHNCWDHMEQYKGEELIELSKRVKNIRKYKI